MTLSTAFTTMFSLRHPIALAPMGGTAGGALSAAVSNGGGLGLLGGGNGDLDWLDRELPIVAEGTGQSWGVGFQSWAVVPGTVERALRYRPDDRQIGGQISANEITKRIAERELTIHQRSITQTEELEAFYRRKFTNRELYEWMASRVSAVYFQSYTLALDLARGAQSAYQYETNSAETFIQYDYRDPAYRGLFAAEGLMLSLNQMQWNWLNKRGRTLEIEKTISLAQWNPKALLDLRETGNCNFELSELLFDLDYPGHYCRKIKSISLTIPAIVGPYQNIKATLTQRSNQIVLASRDVDAVRFLLGENPNSAPGADKLRTNWWVNQQVVLSSGVNDAGLFELNFSDPRYLPFEGTGAVSTWNLSMPMAANRIDYTSLSDVVVSLNYTALDGGKVFRDQVIALAPIKSYAGGRLLLLSRQFPSEWFTMMQSRPADGKQVISFPLSASIVPAQVGGARLTGVYVQLLTNVDATGQNYLTLGIPGIQHEVPVVIESQNAGMVTQSAANFDGVSTLTFMLKGTPPVLLKDGYINPAVLKDIALVVYYTGSLQWQ